MSAVGLRLRAELRARWRSWLALGFAIGVAAGVVVALAAAASRTQSAYGRHLRATAAGDAYVDAGIGIGDPSLQVGRFAYLPQVARSERTFLLAIVSRSRSGRPIFPIGPDHIQYQAPSDDRPANRIDVPLLLRGRLPDPTRADEALADSKALRFLGIGLGDRFTVRLVNRATLLHHLGLVHLSEDPRGRLAATWGALATVRVVGVEAHAKTDVDGGYVNFTPAFRRAHGGAQIGAWTEELAVRLRSHAADAPAFSQAVDAAARGRPYLIFDPGTSRPVIQRSIDLIVSALRLLTVVAAAAALLLGGQALLRSAAVEARTTSTLRALGMTAGQCVGLAAARGAVVALPAVAATVATAVLLSPLAPVGWARQLDPDHGVRFDATAIGLGAAAVVVTVVAVGSLAGWRAARRRPARGARTSPAMQALAMLPARVGLPPAATTGVRMALVSRARDATVPVRATLGGAIAAVAVVVVAMTLVQSATRLLTTPRLYGQTWDYETYVGPTQPALERAVVRDPAVDAVARQFTGPVTVGDSVVGARATEDLKGRLRLTVLEGRAPRAADEALVGTKTLRALHLGIGDAVTVRDGARAVRLRIVGRGVLPSDKWTELGEGVAMRMPAAIRIAPQAFRGGLLVRLAAGADRDAAVARLDWLFGGTNAVRPQEVGDLGRVDRAPLIIALVLGLASGAALAHLLLTSIRRRRRDLAILKTLGFTRAQVFAAIAWQATTVAAVGGLVGVPIGLAVGRFAWNVFAHDLGVAADPVTPLGLSVVVIPAAVLLANAIAAIPARAAAATHPDRVLRAE